MSRKKMSPNSRVQKERFFGIINITSGMEKKNEIVRLDL